MASIPVAFHFRVAFDKGSDKRDHRFQEVTGLSAEVTVEEVRAGGINTHAFRLPTGIRYPNLVLKRGYIADSSVAEWCRRAIEEFSFDPDTVHVTLLNEEHEALEEWTLSRAYPVKWTLADMKAQENALAIESLELAYQSFRKV